MNKPTMWVLVGLSGSGKSSVCVIVVIMTHLIIEYM